MPKRTKRVVRRRPFKRRRTRMARVNRAVGMRPGLYFFKRAYTYEIDLKTNYGLPGSVACSDGKGVVWNFTVSLDTLPNSQEFTNLFAQYKLTGASFKLYPVWSETTTTGATQTDPTAGSVTQTPGASNIIMRTKYDRTGRELTASSTENSWLECQAVTSSMLPGLGQRPIKRYMRLNQLNKLFSGVTSGTEDYSVVSPRFISTDEPSTPHYGMQFRFDTCGGTFATQPVNSGKFKMEVCVYVQCKSTK